MSYDRRRFEAGKKESEYFRRVQGHLIGMIASFYRHVEKAKENLDLGFSRGYDQTVINSCKALFQTFEDYMELEFGPEVAVYFSMMIAQNLFADLVDEERLVANDPTEEECQEARDMIETILKVKIEPDEEKLQLDMIRWIIEIYQRPSFNKFFYGFQTAIYSPRWKLDYYQSLAYHILPHSAKDRWDMDSLRYIAEYLALNIEACCEVIIGDIQERRFTRLKDDLDSGEIDVENCLRFSYMYGIMDFQMRDIDKKLIANDEPARFLLPEFGV